MRLNTKVRLIMLCLSGFELYCRWVPVAGVILALILTNYWR